MQLINAAQDELGQNLDVRPFRLFEPHVKIFVENARYILKTVDRVSELQEVFKLRGSVFSEEYGIEGMSGKLDIDSYDFLSDHLIILDKRDHSVVGTYRLICSTFSSQFYSESEFNLSQFLQIPGVKLELGRACIAKEHRRGAVINLLWRGVVRYAIKTGAEYLFGCSSVKTESPLMARNLMEVLKSKQVYRDAWGIGPRSEYQFQNSIESNLDPQLSEEAIEIPALFQSYLNAGARVIGEPAHDAEFHCIDFFTVVKLSDLTASYEKRYQSEHLFEARSNLCCNCSVFSSSAFD